MSTPARTGRAVPLAPGRPTRPVPRTPAAQTPQARTSTARTSTARTSTARTSTARTSTARTSTARTSTARTSTARTSTARASTARTSTGRTSPARTDLDAGAGPTARTTLRGASSRVAAATAGAAALALPDLGRAPGAPALGGRSRMRVLEQPRTAGRRAGFALTCTAVLGALMLGLLLLNVAISGNAFTMAELQSQRGLLRDQQQSLEQQLLVQTSPSSLSSRARGLGMVPAPQVIVLAPDGTGAPAAPPAPAVPVVAP